MKLIPVSSLLAAVVSISSPQQCLCSVSGSFLPQKQAAFGTWNLSHARRRQRGISSIPLRIRGGSDDEEDTSDDEEESEEYDDEEDEDESLFGAEESDEYDDEYEVEEAEETKASVEVSVEKEVVEYDEPLFMSPMNGIMVQLGVMMLCRKLNMEDPQVIRVARIAFVGYHIVMQLFALYVRIRAKQINDRTPLTIENGIASLVKNQLSAAVSGGGSGDSSNVVKSLANRFLSSQTTVVEYDVSQSDNLRNSYLFSLVLMWFLHFKMKQVQPLFLTVASGLLQWIQAPLFQVYILGRNLERPFRTAGAPPKESPATDAVEQTEEENDHSQSVQEQEPTNDDDDVDEEENEADVEEEDESEAEEEESEEDDDVESEDDPDSSDDAESDNESSSDDEA